MFSISLPALVELIRRSLEDRIDTLGGSLSLWTTIVVAGLILEYGIDFIEKASHHGARKGGRKEPWLPVWFVRFKWLEIAGAIMVVAGVSGELTAESARSEVEGKLRDLSNSTIAGVQQETARDRVAAGIAEKALADELGQQRKLAEQAAAQLEVEKKKRLNLATMLLPRTFIDQMATVRVLLSVPPKSAVFEFLDEHESIAMAEQINNVLLSAHWTTWRQRGDEGSIKDGISISSNFLLNPAGSPSLVPLFAEIDTTVNALLGGLGRSGIIAHWEPSGKDPFDGLPLTTLIIRVGPKPNIAIAETLADLGQSSPQSSLPSPVLTLGIGAIYPGPNSTVRASGFRSPIAEHAPNPVNTKQ
jgi:hypothetical protein